MKVAALTCPQCGGGQDVTDERRLVECRYCRTLLRVECSPSGELERLLVEAQDENAELSLENQKLQLENQIHRLDRGWEATRQTFLIRTKRGQREPSSLWGNVVVVIGSGFLIAGLATLLTYGSTDILPFVLLGFGFFLVLGGLSERGTGLRFENERRSYKQRRDELERRLSEVGELRKFERSYEDTRTRRQRLGSMSYPGADA